MFENVTETAVKDIRTVIPGQIWLEDGEAETDLDIVYDEDGDLPRLFLEDLDPVDYEGAVFSLRDGRKIIAPSMWI